MRLAVITCLFYIFLSLILNCSANFFAQNVFPEESFRVRVRRQDGYVYDKPRISFDLPSQSTTESTQAPTVDRTLTQQMFYAYPAPAPAVGNVVNIGNTAGTTVGTPVTSTPVGGTAGYNYRSTATSNVGYNYGTSASTGAQANTALQVTSTASQTAVTGSQSAANSGSSQVGSGYGYNVPSPTLSPSLQGSTEVSTNAPKYLPPISGGETGGSTGGGSVNIGSVSSNINVEQVTTGSSTKTSAGTPSDTYLPPLGATNAVSNGQSVTSTSGTQSNIGGSVSVPSTAYLPPIPSPSSAPSPLYQPTGTSPPATPAGGYIPPSNTGSSSGTVSTPSSGYLPPGFF